MKENISNNTDNVIKEEANALFEEIIRQYEEGEISIAEALVMGMDVVMGFPNNKSFFELMNRNGFVEKED
ncbi:hypothetical protein ACFL1M_01450 [Patescibacteria group bacterium]